MPALEIFKETKPWLQDVCVSVFLRVYVSTCAFSYVCVCACAHARVCVYVCVCVRDFAHMCVRPTKQNVARQ